MARPLLTLILSFIAGLGLAPWGSAKSALAPLTFSLLLALSSLVLLLLHRFKISFFCLALAFFFFGPFWYHKQQELPPHHLFYINLPEEKVYVEGVVNRPSEEIAAGEADDEGEVPVKTRIYLSVEKIKIQETEKEVTGDIRVTLLEAQRTYSYGSKIGLWAKLKKIRNYKNPGAFDFEGYMRCRGIFHSTWVKDESAVTILSEGETNPFWAKIYSLRERILRSLGEPLEHPDGSILKALVLGDRSGLTPQVNQAFLDSGTYHLLAISGMNVAAVGLSAFFFFRLLWLGRKGAAAGSILTVNFYALMAGASPSVIRAALMASLFFLALILEREGEIYTVLAFSAFIILLINPLYLFDVGFLLTFGATIGIVYLVPRFPCPWERKPLRWLWDSLLVSLAATLAVSPLLAYHFNRFSWVGIVANLIVVPLCTLITILGMAAGFFSLLIPPTIIYWFVKLTGFLVHWLYQATVFFAGWPSASVRVYTPTVPMILSFYLGIYGLINIKNHPAYKTLSTAALSVLIILVGVKLWAPDFRSSLEVTFLDVGQGECILIELPKGKTIMIDGGGSYSKEFDMGERVVAPYLWRKWIRNIDLLVIAYTAPDHIGGLPFILENFKVQEVWDTPRQSRYSRLLGELRYLIRYKKIKQREVFAGDSWEGTSGVSFKVLHPAEDFMRIEKKNPNAWVKNLSIVTKINHQGYGFLFTGDIDAEEENALLEQKQLHSRVLKVPRHGAKTAAGDSLLERAAPQAAVISAGLGNRFHYPAAESLERLKAAGVKIYRTDEVGAVSVIIKDNRIKFESYEKYENK